MLPASLLCREPLFLLHEIDRENSESAAVWDIDRDGRPDVSSGRFWYRNPDWKKTEYLEPRLGRPTTNCTELVVDVNKDGYPDLIGTNWDKTGIWYYENPKEPGVVWKGVKVLDTVTIEGMIPGDVDGDGMPDIIPSHWTDQPVYWVQIKDGKFIRRPVGPAGAGHGVGFADIDGDGKKDIITGRGWHRQIDLSKDLWEYHADFHFEGMSIPIEALDLNGDGLIDLIFGLGHDYGLFWLEQRMTDGKRSWVRHIIDDNYSQIHVIGLHDINGDGKPELIAGKRYRGHNEHDPGAYDPISIMCYTIEFGKEPKFKGYPIAFNSIAGGGMQLAVADLDGDGDLDIVVAGKTGQYWFENLLIDNVPRKQRDILYQRYPSRL
jgi:hypothetical protein